MPDHAGTAGEADRLSEEVEILIRDAVAGRKGAFSRDLVEAARGKHAGEAIQCPDEGNRRL